MPNITPEQYAAFLQQLQAQQQAAPAAPGGGLPVQPAQPVQPPAPTVPVSVGDALGGNGYGPNLWNKADTVGTSFTGVVAQPVTAVQDTDFKTKQPKVYDDGRAVPKLVIGLDVPVSPRHPEGRATWWAKGKDLTAINRAMVDAGVPADVIKQVGPEVGATITVTYARDQINPKFPDSNAAKIREVVYTRPGTSTPPPVQVVQQPAALAPAPVQNAGLPAVGGAMSPEQILAQLINAQAQQPAA